MGGALVVGVECCMYGCGVNGWSSSSGYCSWLGYGMMKCCGGICLGVNPLGVKSCSPSRVSTDFWEYVDCLGLFAEATWDPYK